MINKLSGKSYLLICEEAEAGGHIAKIAKKFNNRFSKTSPDTIQVRPEKKHVTIDQVRELRTSVYQKPVQDPFKLIIIYQADNLTAEAQNALLKLLEEPPSHALIILQAKNKDALLQTILSRTEIITVHKKIEEADIDLFGDYREILEKIVTVENSLEFLDRQIIRLVNRLMSKKESFADKNRLVSAIDSCRDAKKMIEANVDTRHVLANLVLTVNLASSHLAEGL